MAFLHQTFAGFFAVVLAPAALLGPLAGLVVISAMAGVLLLFAFRFTSRPRAIRAAKNRVQAHLLAVRIYRDDLGIVFRSQARLFVALGAYMGNMIVPFLAILAPFALLFAHLDARFASRALRPGETAVVEAAVAADGLDRWSLEASGGIAVETPPVRIPSRGEIAWRIRAVTPGVHRVALVAGGRRVEKEVLVSAEPLGASPRREAAGVSSLLFAPVETPIGSADGVRAVEVAYPPLALEAFGWRAHWIVVFLVVSVIVALALRKRVGVEF